MISLFLATLMLIQLVHSIPRKTLLSCHDKSIALGYPVIEANCKYFYHCDGNQNSEARRSAKISRCPKGLFDFKLQTCVKPSASFICEVTELSNCKAPKCNCKLCHCHSNLCETRCRPYINQWCGERLPRISNFEVFDCSDKFPGASYSDPQFDCQVYHTCHQKYMGSPLLRKTRQCPPGRAFDQLRLSCQPTGTFDCDSVTKWYLIRRINEKPSIPFRVLTTTEIDRKRIPSQPQSTATIVEHVGVKSHVPVIPTVTEVTSVPTSNCPEYQCCPGICPPCHEICPYGICSLSQEWCEVFYKGPQDTNEPDVFNFDDETDEEVSLNTLESCSGKVHGGLYANITDNCKTFYNCISDSIQLTVVPRQCPIGTYFNQKRRICDWNLNFPCRDSHLYF